MSRRKREAVERAAIDEANLSDAAINQPESFTNPEIEPATAKSANGGNWRRRWSGLSFQSKLLSVVLIGLFSLGAFGAGWKYLDEQAKAVVARREVATPLDPSPEGLLARVNPLVPVLTPTPAPQLSKEYIYAGSSRLLAVEDANANAAPPADLAVWRPSGGVWWVMGGAGSQQFNMQWGQSGDIPAPGDYDGDGKTDFCIFRPDAANHLGSWYIFHSAANSWLSYQFGLETDKPAVGDYDGDGKTDIAVWRPADGIWYVLRSSDGGVTSFQLGAGGDVPAQADYDGDGRADFAVWRSSNNTIYSADSSDSAARSVTFTSAGSEAVSADYDGDGKADYAIRSGADWIIRNSSTNQTQTIAWQQAADRAVPNDYDGDGKTDIAVWNDANGNWYIRQSSLIGQTGELRQVQWGQTGDIPVPAFYRR